MRPLRVAVWGLGLHAVNNILPAVSATNGLELHGVCSRTAGVVSSCSEKWKCKGWIEAAHMLGSSDVDAIYIATPIGLHAEHARQVLDSGKHLWCEKPLSRDLSSTLELLESAKMQGLSICEGFMYLHHPQFRRLCKFVTEGSLGTIRSVTCRFGIPPLERPGFRSDPSLGGGALLDVGCYPLSAINALFPGQELHIYHAAITHRKGSAVDTDGHALVAISGAALATLEWRTHCAYRNEIDIWGETGSVSTEKIFSKAADYVPMFRTRDIRGTESTETGEPANHFVSMLEYFRRTVEDAGAAETERNSVAGRAALLDRVLFAARPR